jgi:hypothetical protein
VNATVALARLFPLAIVEYGHSSHRRLSVPMTLLLLLNFVPASAQTQPSEYQLKAAFVYHFAQMVEWPNDYLDANSPLVICSTDDDSFAAALDWAVDGKQIGAHAVQTRHVRDLTLFHGCHVLVIASKDKSRVSSILSRVKDEAILTVGDSDDFLASGGLIGLSIQDNKVRFDINLNSAQHANLKISSRLLLLARNVVGVRKVG